MVRAREYDRDPFDVLDEEIGWDRLVASREEIAALGDLATQDPLSLATQRYAQLRRFAPAFLEAFEFDAPASGQGLQAAVTLLRELNRTGKRNLPDIVMRCCGECSVVTPSGGARLRVEINEDRTVAARLRCYS